MRELDNRHYVTSTSMSNVKNIYRRRRNYVEESESEAPAAEEMLDRVVCSREQFSFQMFIIIIISLFVQQRIISDNNKPIQLQQSWNRNDKANSTYSHQSLCSLKVVMYIAELFVTGDREFQTAGAVILNVLHWKLWSLSPADRVVVDWRIQEYELVDDNEASHV